MNLPISKENKSKISDYKGNLVYEAVYSKLWRESETLQSMRAHEEASALVADLFSKGEEETEDEYILRMSLYGLNLRRI